MPGPRFRAVRRGKLEKSIEHSVVEYAANKYDLLAYKLNVQGRRNLPDRMFLLPGGRPLFIEFKREGEEPRPGQAYERNRLLRLGYDIRIVDNVAEGKRIIDSAYKQALERQNA